MQTTAVYSTLQSVLDVFHDTKYKSDPDVLKLLSIYSKAKEQSKLAVKQYPLIVLEGLDLSGKTTITKKLSNRLNGVGMKSPPTCISPELRQAFDDRNDLKTAFYTLSNYILEFELLTKLEKMPVVLDRFWHSTTANGLARAIHHDNITLPPKGDDIYNWPEDLIKPDIVLMLRVSEHVRLERQARRGVITDEENLLKNNRQFRENVLKAYENMDNPPVHFVNSDVYVNKVLKSIQQEFIGGVLKEYGINQ